MIGGDINKHTQLLNEKTVKDKPKIRDGITDK